MHIGNVHSAVPMPTRNRMSDLKNNVYARTVYTIGRTRETQNRGRFFLINGFIIFISKHIDYSISDTYTSCSRLHYDPHPSVPSSVAAFPACLTWKLESSGSPAIAIILIQSLTKARTVLGSSEIEIRSMRVKYRFILLTSWAPKFFFFSLIR